MISFVEISGFAARDGFKGCEKWFIEACERVPLGLEDIHSLYREVITNGATLLLIYDDSKLCGGSILRKRSAPACDVLDVVVLGGEGMAKWFGEWNDRLTEIAKRWRCKYIFEGGRKGWVRYLKQFGWEEAPRLMVRAI